MVNVVDFVELGGAVVGISTEAWIGIAAVIVAVVGILVGRVVTTRKRNTQKQISSGGISIQSGRDTKIGK